MHYTIKHNHVCIIASILLVTKETSCGGGVCVCVCWGGLSEGEVNEDISHETLTRVPIMRCGGRRAEKGPSINKMGHYMNVEYGLSMLRKSLLILHWDLLFWLSREKLGTLTLG